MFMTRIGKVCNIETQFSQLNILINNAGIGGGGVESCDLETWDQVHRVDLTQYSMDVSFLSH